MYRSIGLVGLLTLLLTLLASVAQGATCYAVTASGRVLTFQTGAPSTLQNDVALTGVPASEEVLGCDIRPADGKLYLVTTDATETGLIYTLDPATGAATLVVAISQKVSGGFVAMDVNPVLDQIRLVANAFQNVRVHPVTGILQIDMAPAYAPGDPAAGTFPTTFAYAYTNNFAGAGATSLYAIDSGTDSLVLQSPENGGVLHTVGPLGVDPGGHAAFDIAPSPLNHGFAALRVGLTTSLYFIDLATGHASDLGTIGTGGADLLGFTVAPGYPQTGFRRQQDLSIVAANGGGYQELSFNYTTQQILITPYSNVSRGAARIFPFAEWAGVFHYDYTAAAFTQAVYYRQHPL